MPVDDRLHQHSLCLNSIRHNLTRSGLLQPFLCAFDRPLTSRSLTTGQAIATLEDAITFSPSAALIEPIIFNLTTLYELRLGAAQAAEKKLDLLVKVR